MRGAIERAAEAAGLTTRLIDRALATLSGGERAQATALVALVAAPTLLIADEPFGGLDAQATAHLAATLATHASTRVVALHEAAHLATAAEVRLELPARGDSVADETARTAPTTMPTHPEPETLLRLVGALARERHVAPATVLLDRGTITIVEGPTGSGKSTLLGLVAGTLALRDGARSAKKDLVIRFAPQDPGLLLGTRPVLEHLDDADLSRARAIASVMGVASLLNIPPGRLSDGERRRLALVVVFAVRPDIAVLDEPTDGLDDLAAEAVRCVALNAAAGEADRTGSAVLIATHDKRLAMVGARHVRQPFISLDAKSSPPVTDESGHAAGQLLAPNLNSGSTTTLVARANPLTRVGVAVLWFCVAVVSPATLVQQAGIALVAVVVATCVGVSIRAMGRLALLLTPAVAGLTLANVIGGASASFALGAGARLVALAAGSLIAVRPVEPLRLADAAIERLRAPFAPTMALLATLATIPAMRGEALERQAIRRLSRRASGPWALIDMFDASVRAVPRLAMALETRGVRLASRANPPSRLRPSLVGRADAILIALNVVFVALVVAWVLGNAPLPAILQR
jgi:energy-coupling factor transport system ATP-binding protein